MASGYIVILNISEPSALVTLLADALVQRDFTVIMDEIVLGYNLGYMFEGDAAAIVAASSGPAKDFDGYWDWADVSKTIPVKLARDVEFPGKLRQLDAVNLSDKIDGGPGFEDLVGRLDALLRDSPEAHFPRSDYGELGTHLAPGCHWTRAATLWRGPLGQWAHWEDWQMMSVTSA